MTKRGMTPQQAAELRAKKGIEETKLQKIRVKRGLSQSELAKIADMPVRRIQLYENNIEAINGARLETLCNLCIALNCKISDILESKELAEKLKKTK